MTQDKTTEARKPRKHATEAAGRIPGMVKAALSANLQAEAEGKPIAYAFIFCGYDEIIRAMDIVPAWTENYAGICGVKRDTPRFLEKSESENFSRSLCTYATTGLGFDMMREELDEMPPNPPWGGQARPTVMLGSGQLICEPRYKWYQAAQHFMPDVPVHVHNMPWPPYEDDYDYQEIQDYYVRYIVEELRELIAFLEMQIGRKIDWDRLNELVELTDKTWDMYFDAYELCRHVPTPMDAGDMMNTMVPSVFMMATQEAYDFYRDLYDELKYRIDNKMWVVPDEKYRIMWGGGLPSWFALTDFNYFNSKGAVFPLELAYRNIERIDHLDLPRVSDPLEHLAWRWFKFWTHWYDKARRRPGSHPDVERIIQYIEEYKIDGIVMHEAFSCRAWHPGLIWKLNLLRKVYGDIPSLILESDIVDISSYNEADTRARIDAFIDTLEAAKSKKS